MINKIQRSCFLALLLSVLAVSGYAQGVILDWARLVGGPSALDFGVSVATDRWGNVYSTGFFNDSVDFDPGPGITKLGAVGNNDVFLTKFDAAGNFKWARAFGNTNEDKSFAVKVDQMGNVVIAGQFALTVNLNPGGTNGVLTAGSLSDVFVAKYDSTGTLAWAKRMGSNDPNDDIAYGIDVDATGNVYVTGEYSDTADFDPGPGTANLIATGNSDVFITKLSPAGNFVWAKSLGGAAWFEYGYSVAVDRQGNVYSTGVFQDVADFDPGPGTANLTAAGSYDVYISKLDSMGNYVWAKRVGGTMEDFGYGLTLSDSGDVYITGYYGGTADFDPGAGTTNLTSAGGSDVYIARYTRDGELVWAKSIGGTSYDFSQSIAVDKRGNAYVTGFFFPNIDLDPSAATANFTSNGDNDVFIVKLDYNGNYKWGKTFGGTGVDFPQEIAVDASGGVYSTGYVEATVDFDPNAGTTNLTSAGGWDFYVQKLICVDTNSSVANISVCEDSYTFNGTTYTTSGTYTAKLINMSGCDSTAVINLTIKGSIEEPVITVSGFVLGTTLAYNSYQWYKNNAIIPGATNPTYTVTQNADYKVVVSNEQGCTDTSAIYTVTNVTDINDPDFLKSRVSVYPNPSSDILYIQSPVPVQVVLTSIEGKVILQPGHTKQLSVKGLADGMYLLRIMDKSGTLIKTEKVTKNHK